MTDREDVPDLMSAAVGGRRGVDAADRLCEVYVDLFDVDAAAISLVFDGVAFGTLGVSGTLARAHDEMQFTLGEGPCLQAVAHRAPVLVPDLADPTEQRWPGYTPAMLARDVHGVFAVPVVVAGEYVGALDLFRADPGALGVAALAGALIAAELAELPLLDIVAAGLDVETGPPDAATWTDAWTELNALTRVEISQATGMLVAQLEVDPVEALARLRAHAYAENRSPTDVARDILERRLRLPRD